MKYKVWIVLLCFTIFLRVPAALADGASFPWGQCTYWAAAERPDLRGIVWGNAWHWVYEARYAGVPTGYVPRVGAVAVFQPWTYDADGYGHVAYVTAVDGNYFQVSEMNFPWLGHVDYRWVLNQGGISFIYRWR